MMGSEGRQGGGRGGPREVRTGMIGLQSFGWVRKQWGSSTTTLTKTGVKAKIGRQPHPQKKKKKIEKVEGERKKALKERETEAQRFGSLVGADESTEFRQEILNLLRSALKSSKKGKAIAIKYQS